VCTWPKKVFGILPKCVRATPAVPDAKRQSFKGPPSKKNIWQRYCGETRPALFRGLPPTETGLAGVVAATSTQRLAGRAASLTNSPFAEAVERRPSINAVSSSRVCCEAGSLVCPASESVSDACLRDSLPLEPRLTDWLLRGPYASQIASPAGSRLPTTIAQEIRSRGRERSQI
jgi:hypothetical protein